MKNKIKDKLLAGMLAVNIMSCSLYGLSAKADIHMNTGILAFNANQDLEVAVDDNDSLYNYTFLKSIADVTSVTFSKDKYECTVTPNVDGIIVIEIKSLNDIVFTSNTDNLLTLGDIAFDSGTFDIKCTKCIERYNKRVYFTTVRENPFDAWVTERIDLYVDTGNVSSGDTLLKIALVPNSTVNSDWKFLHSVNITVLDENIQIDEDDSALLFRSSILDLGEFADPEETMPIEETTEDKLADPEMTAPDLSDIELIDPEETMPIEEVSDGELVDPVETMPIEETIEEQLVDPEETMPIDDIMESTESAEPGTIDDARYKLLIDRYDVNKDGKINAVDASIILALSAEHGSGTSIEELYNNYMN